MSSDIFPPARCTASLPEEFNENHVAEEKMDGSRYVLYIGKGVDPYGRQKENALLSRRVSTVDNKHVDRTKQVPHITKSYDDSVHDTVLDGEIFLKDFGTTSSIISCSPSLAVQKQESEGYLIFHAFDCVKFRGKDIRGLAFEKRRKVLLEVIKRLDNPFIKAIEQFDCDFEKHFNEIVSGGGEGLIVKDKRFGYGTGWAKYKKAFEVSAIVTGFKSGNGKYKNSVGSLEVSVFKDGKAVPCGYVSGFDDATRSDIAKNPKNYLGRVVDINAMRLNKPSAANPCGRLFQPTFFRWRDDYTADEVTFEKLKDDFKKKAKNNRRKFGG